MEQDIIAHSNSLADLAARIKQEHEAATAFMKRGLERDICAGDLLLQAKAQLAHGQWLPWLRENCGVPERSASHYMRLARHAHEIGNLADLTVAEAVALIGKPTTESIEPEPGSREWAEAQLNGPFDDWDFGTDDWHWLEIKMFHHANVPAMFAELDQLFRLWSYFRRCDLCRADESDTAACLRPWSS